MNYRKIYEDIIIRAKERPKPECYTERHHIVPKSLGGSNKKENLAVLTAREHFICHWLLVKMYAKGTEERKKMLCAFFFMRSEPNERTRRYISSRTYEKYRIEYGKTIGETASVSQKGENNSMAGMSWYTNINDGSYKRFKTYPSADWIRGRNSLSGQTCSILHLHKSMVYLEEAHNRWNRFHSGNWKSLADFDRDEGRSRLASIQLFRCEIPIYTDCTQQKLRRFKSDKSLVGVYEKPNENWVYGGGTKANRCADKIDYEKFVQERWDRFHAGEWNSLSEFDTAEGRKVMASCMLFTKRIPLYKNCLKSKGKKFRSDKSLIGRYE